MGEYAAGIYNDGAEEIDGVTAETGDGANVDTDGGIKLDGELVGELILDISLYIIKRKIYSFFKFNIWLCTYCYS